MREDKRGISRRGKDSPTPAPPAHPAQGMSGAPFQSPDRQQRCLPSNPQEQGEAPERGAQCPPPGRVHVEDFGVSGPGDMLTRVVQLVGQVAQDGHAADKHILLLQEWKRVGGGPGVGGTHRRTHPLSISRAQAIPGGSHRARSKPARLAHGWHCGRRKA